MNLSLQEVDHLITALETMSSYDIARAREQVINGVSDHPELIQNCLLYTSPSPRDATLSRMPSSA